MVPRGLQEAPRGRHEAPRGPQEAPREASNMPQRRIRSLAIACVCFAGVNACIRHMGGRREGQSGKEIDVARELMMRGAMSYGMGGGGGATAAEASSNDDEGLVIDASIELQRHHKKFEKLTSKQIAYILTTIPGTGLYQDKEKKAVFSQRLNDLTNSIRD
eukprot:9489690-Pyramimonas_sp.AAC.1